MTIEQLENCRSAKGEIESLRERMERIKSDRERMTQTITGMPQSKGKEKSRIEELTVKLMELEEQLVDRIQQRETWIETLKPYQRNVIRLRYIDGRTWRQIEKKTHYTKDGAMRIHRKVKKCLPFST